MDLEQRIIAIETLIRTEEQRRLDGIYIYPKPESLIYPYLFWVYNMCLLIINTN